jgi:ribonuclease BN (tRNA processing enzyme)
VRLTTVGTGTAAPVVGRVQAGHLLESGDVRLLLDCGSGVSFRLASLGIDWATITHVALTHFHADHVLDVPTMLTAWRYGMLPPRSAPLEIIGPVGTATLVDRLTEALGIGWREYGFPVTIREMPAGERLTIGEGVALESRSVPHTAESVAYLIEGSGRRVAYSGDTGYDEGFARWAAGCDVLLCECSLPESMAIPTHLTPEQVAAIAKIAAPGLLALTHMYPPLETVDVPAAIAAHHAGPVVVCRDGWSTEL